MRRAGVGGLFAVVAALLGAAAPARAAAPIRVALSPAGELSVVGTRADDNVRFTRAGDAYQLTAEQRSTLRAGGGCHNTARKVAVCPLAAVKAIGVATGDGLDVVRVGSVEPFTVPLTISTGPGHDLVDLGFEVVGPAVVEAGPGDDWISGGAGSDRLDGGDGDDTIDGLPGVDTLLGGRGDDFLADSLPESTPTSDTIDCGPGVDEPRANLGQDVTLACEQPPSEWSVFASGSSIKYRFRRFGDGTTMFTRIRVSGTRVGSDVVVECRGRACPSRTWRARRYSQYSLDARGPLVARRLPPRTRVTVTVASPGRMTKVVELTVRRGRAPALGVHCVGPISGIVTRAACRAAGLPVPGAPRD